MSHTLPHLCSPLLDPSLEPDKHTNLFPFIPKPIAIWFYAHSSIDAALSKINRYHLVAKSPGHLVVFILLNHPFCFWTLLITLLWRHDSLSFWSLNFWSTFLWRYDSLSFWSTCYWFFLYLSKHAFSVIFMGFLFLFLALKMLMLPLFHPWLATFFIVYFILTFQITICVVITLKLSSPESSIEY